MKLWSKEEEAEQLRKRFDEAKKRGRTQRAVAVERSFPGGASMINQHLTGNRPMNLDHARIYAEEFGVPIAEISPRLAMDLARAISANPSTAEGPSPKERAAPVLSEMPFSPHSLHNTILVLGSLLSALDGRSRRYLSPILADLALSPDDAAELADKAVALARTSGKGQFQSPDLARSITAAPPVSGVETDVAPLEAGPKQKR